MIIIGKTSLRFAKFRFVITVAFRTLVYFVSLYSFHFVSHYSKFRFVVLRFVWHFSIFRCVSFRSLRFVFVS